MRRAEHVRSGGSGRVLDRLGTRRLALGLALALAVGVTAAALSGLDLAHGQGAALRLLRGRVDGGAAEHATAGQYLLAAAIGQPGARRLRGERLTLQAGIFGHPAHAAPPTSTPTPAPGEPTPTTVPPEPRPTATRRVLRVEDTIFLPRTVRGE